MSRAPGGDIRGLVFSGLRVAGEHPTRDPDPRRRALARRPINATTSTREPAAAIALRDGFVGWALVGMIPTPRTPGVLPLSIEGMAEVDNAYAPTRCCALDV